jgi:hypothetical protein
MVQSRINAFMNRFAGIHSVFTWSPWFRARKLIDTGIRIWIVRASPRLRRISDDKLTGIEVLLVERESEIVATNLLNHPDKGNIREIMIGTSAAD